MLIFFGGVGANLPYFFLHFNITACWGETHFKFNNYMSFW